MTIVNDLVYNFIDQHKVFAYALFIEDTTVVSEDLHHAVNYVEHAGRLHVVFASSNKVDTKLLGEEVVDAIDILIS